MISGKQKNSKYEIRRRLITSKCCYSRYGSFGGMADRTSSHRPLLGTLLQVNEHSLLAFVWNVKPGSAARSDGDVERSVWHLQYIWCYSNSNKIHETGQDDNQTDGTGRERISFSGNSDGTGSLPLKPFKPLSLYSGLCLEECRKKPSVSTTRSCIETNLSGMCWIVNYVLSISKQHGNRYMGGNEVTYCPTVI